MAVTELNFSLDQGAVFVAQFPYNDDDGNPINLTNYCARICVQDGASFNKTYLSGNADSSYSLEVTSDGLIVLQFSASETASMTFSSARYDLDIKAPNELYTGAGANIIRLYQGFITINPRLTTNPDDFNCPTPTNPCVTC